MTDDSERRVYASIAQWQSIGFPSRGLRVRVPLDAQKKIFWMETNIYKVAKEKGYRIDINGNAFSRKQQLKVRKKKAAYPYYCFNIKVGGKYS